MNKNYIIRETDASDVADLLEVHLSAFGEKEGPEVKELVSLLFDDETAIPIISLAAEAQGKIIGHILFTRGILTGTVLPVQASILAPLGVLPDEQKKGAGGLLIKEGLKLLTEAGVDLVFVLGHPDYYPRYGFKPAGVLGLEASYPIPPENADAWMVQELKSGILGHVNGKVQCCEVLNRPEYWRE